MKQIATSSFANSPFTKESRMVILVREAKFGLTRINNRTGMLPFVFDDSFGFEQYVDYALDVPMYFIYRKNKYIDCTWNDFMSGKLVSIPCELPTLNDWENHPTTIFPEVRLKRCLEMRGANGGPWRRLCALPAFWVFCLFYPGESMENALRACCKGIKIEKILIHRDGDNGKQLIYEKLPKDISERHVLLLNPVLATGNSANQAIELLIQKGVPESHIIFLNLISVSNFCSAGFKKLGSPFVVAHSSVKALHGISQSMSVICPGEPRPDTTKINEVAVVDSLSKFLGPIMIVMRRKASPFSVVNVVIKISRNQPGLLYGPRCLRKIIPEFISLGWVRACIDCR
ncbi:hypothetical protein LOK49_LG03G00690 [Camellia lanceoleosa]|uniref:Uncharacterized protein n=1 Tax=Camellia lanceoleosa TaxID=1840588 RepID=A0ACC0IFU0_9ERIC|nr:hypothetical protein LOK49_LG03G00690 [Camellia lanceoleosa]